MQLSVLSGAIGHENRDFAPSFLWTWQHGIVGAVAVPHRKTRLLPLSVLSVTILVQLF
jgi:hypothetical protein